MPPLTPLSNVLNYPKQDDAPPRLDPVDIDLSEDGVSVENGVKKTELPDGSLEIDLHGGGPKKAKSDKFHANLAEEMEESDLNRISTEILEGIDRDISSRSDHMEMIAEGMKLLGLVIESNNANSASSSAPLEGMSTVRHPLLLEACQLFQANAMGELLPASGPVKVRDDRPQKPEGLIGHNGGPPLDNPFALPGVSSPPPGLGAPGASAPPGAGVQPQQPMQPPQGVPNGPPPVPGAPMGAANPGGAPISGPPGGTNPPSAGPQPGLPPAVVPPPMEPPGGQRDELANALEKDLNHYLTTVAKEYYPDTDQMLFKVGFSGLGVKKIFNCPLRRRPVSESIDIEDFIVSNALTDLSNAGRITHRIKMRPSTLKRMQILEVYRDVPIGMPTIQSDNQNQVDEAKANIAGVQVNTDPRDMDHELYECYCELDLPEYAPKQFRDKGLQLPYKVTIEKESKKVLEVRRNWREEDKECQAREYFVDFPYMRAFGFYCIGLLHLLGNTTKALTALWREFIDAGMFANFPGFLYLKGAGRQLTNQFRVAPGSGVGLDSSVSNIQQAVMPLPYKSPDTGFVAFVQHVEELGTRLGGTANTNVGEGRQDAPVGTTLALLEQATKPLGAVTKRLHQSQARELELLKDRFRDDPEAFWRFNKRPAMAWEKQVFLQALDDYDFVPVSDPNNPTRMHRAAKAEWLKQVAAGAPGLLDAKKTFLRAAAEMEIGDVEDLISPTYGQAQQPPVDPAKMADVQHKNNKLQADAATDAQKIQSDMQMKQMELQNAEADRQNKLQLAQLSENTERLRLASTIAIHSDKMDEAQKGANIKLISDHASQAYDQAHQSDMASQQHGQDLQKSAVGHAQELQKGDIAHQRAVETADVAHDRTKELAKAKPKGDAK